MVKTLVPRTREKVARYENEERFTAYSDPLAVPGDRLEATCWGSEYSPFDRLFCRWLVKSSGAAVLDGTDYLLFVCWEAHVL